MMKLINLILSTLFLITPLTLGLSQDLESKLQHLLEKNKIDELRTNLEIIKKKYPDHAIPYFIEAFIEKDGEKAIARYKDFILRFPKSSYVANAKYKIAQYHYARGLYRSAKQLLDDILRYNSDSPYADDAYYLKIRCLIALKQINQAESDIKNFVKKYTQSPLKKLAQYDLKHMKKSTSNQLKRQVNQYSVESIKRLHQNYAIQVGAYLEKKNAINQMNTISKWGFPVEVASKIVDHNLFHLVWVGNFETEEQALNFGEIFKKKYGLSFHVVSKNRE